MSNYKTIQDICIELIEACFAGTPPSGDIVEWARHNDKKTLGQQILSQTETASLTAIEKACTLIRTESKVPENLAMTQQMTKAKIEQIGCESLIGYTNTITTRKQQFEQAEQNLENFKNNIKEAGINDWMEGTNRTRMLVSGYGSNGTTLTGTLFAGLGACKNTAERKKIYQQEKANLDSKLEQVEQNEIFEVIEMLKKMPGEFADMLINLVEGGNVDPKQRAAVENKIYNASANKVNPLMEFLADYQAAYGKICRERKAEQEKLGALRNIEDAKSYQKIKLTLAVASLIMGGICAAMAIVAPNKTIPFEGLASFAIPIGLVFIPHRLHWSLKIITIIIGFPLVLFAILSIQNAHNKAVSIKTERDNNEKRVKEIDDAETFAPQLADEIKKITDNPRVEVIIIQMTEFTWKAYLKNKSTPLDIEAATKNTFLKSEFNMLKAYKIPMNDVIKAANNELLRRNGAKPTASIDQGFRTVLSAEP